MITVANQKPVVLSPVYDAVISGDFDPCSYIKANMVKPLFTPLVAGQQVTMTAQNQPVTEDNITELIANSMSSSIDPNIEQSVKDLYHQTLVYFNNNTHIPMQNIFTIQSMTKEKLPEPSAQVVYTPSTDIVPVCKEFLASIASADKLFASFSLWAQPNTLGVYFANDRAFDDFKAWLDKEVATIASGLTPETNQLFADFQKLTLQSLTESVLLRSDDSDNNDPYSFARTLIAYIMQYAKTPNIDKIFGIMPFSAAELFCPKSIVFVNIERHSRATSRAIKDEWDLINKSLVNRPRVISNRKLQKLTASARMLRQARSNAQNAVAQQGQNPVMRAANTRFRKTPPSTFDLTKAIVKIISKMSNVAKSENTYKSMKMTFARPNRRNPDDFNKQGKMVSTKYHPDLHIYIDTSGSIDEYNYQDAVKSCIAIAKKLNVNLYFNSFSHILSQSTLLHTRDKSLKDIYREFQRVPKVTGGTDYEQIWHYINASKKRKRELSIIMTDFEWSVPSHFVEQPKNLYYAPCSHLDWDYLVNSATDFCKSMTHLKPDIRSHIMF